MSHALRVLIVEDEPSDAELVVRELCRAGFAPEWERVDCEADYSARLHPDLDIILSDFSMPTFSGIRALAVLKERGLQIPFIIVSGTIGEDLAVAAMKEGAADYLLKDRLTRLGPAVHLALDQQRLRKESARAEEAMRQSEHKYRHLFQSLSEAAFLMDAHSRRILDANLCAESLLGLTRSEILGMNVADLFPPKEGSECRAQFAQALTSGEGKLEEVEIQTKDGVTVPIAASIAPIELHGRDLLLVLMTDIRNRKRTEERLREQASLLDHARDAIIVQDLEGRMSFWNKSAERVFGWTAEEALGRRMQELLFEKPAEYLNSLETVVRCGEWTGEVTKHSKDGRSVLIEGRWTLVRNEAGEPREILSINTDITEFKRIEAHFFRAQRLESIGMLAGGIAHDLNNILGPIIMAAELLKMHADRLPDPSLIETIELSAARGAEMVKHVLSFARGVETRRVILRPADLFEEMRKITRETFQKKISVQIRDASDVWNIPGEPTQLHQVLLNLCVNARDAMPEGGTLTLSAHNLQVDEQYATGQAAAKPGPYVVLEVADTGRGIPPEILGRIFEPFFTTKEVGKGTGFGLSTSSTIVKLHDGFIIVESEPGKGTTFRVHLPAAPQDDAGLVRELTELPRGDGELILVIDDEALFRSITFQTLEAFGYRVMTAADGAEGVAFFAQNAAKIALVLTDLEMPVMDGAATARVILRLDPAAKIIGATGVTGKRAESEFAKVGVQHFLPKPYTADAMLKMIHAILHPEKASPV